MKFFQKNLAFVLIGLVSVVLGVLAIMTSVKLRQEKPIAPTAPESKPKAVEPQCQLSFTLTLSTPNPSPSSSPSPTPSSNPEASPSPSPTANPTPTAVPTPSSIPGCNSICTTNNDCTSNLICYIPSGQTSGNCRNNVCSANTNCVCESSSTPTIPTTGSTMPTIIMIAGGILLLILGLAF